MSTVQVSSPLVSTPGVSGSDVQDVVPSCPVSVPAPPPTSLSFPWSACWPGTGNVSQGMLAPSSAAGCDLSVVQSEVVDQAPVPANLPLTSNHAAFPSPWGMWNPLLMGVNPYLAGLGVASTPVQPCPTALAAIPTAPNVSSAGPVVSSTGAVTGSSGSLTGPLAPVSAPVSFSLGSLGVPPVLTRDHEPSTLSAPPVAPVRSGSSDPVLVPFSAPPVAPAGTGPIEQFVPLSEDDDSLFSDEDLQLDPTTELVELGLKGFGNVPPASPPAKRSRSDLPVSSAADVPQSTGAECSGLSAELVSLFQKFLDGQSHLKPASLPVDARSGPVRGRQGKRHQADPQNAFV